MTKDIINSLRNTVRNAILSSVPLSKEQKSRWIKHPLAVSKPNENLTDLIPPYQRSALIQAPNAVYGGMGREPKKTPPKCLSFGRHCFAATRSTLNINLFKEIPNMLYTFLIAFCDQKIAQLERIRTVTAVADTETQARAQLNGLPLVFVSRESAKAGA